MSDALCPTCGQYLASAIIDWSDFGLQVRLAMARRNMSYRKVADALGSDQATIHRVAVHGKPIRAETYRALLTWMQEMNDG